MTQTKSAQSQPKDSAERICEVALQLFLERGYDNTPLSLIAKHLDLTKSGIYHHFESKEQLLYEINHKYIELLMTPILLKAAAARDPEARVRVFINDYTLMLATNSSARLLVAEAKRLSPEHYAEVKRAWRASFDLLRDNLVEMQRAGLVPKELDPSFTAFAAIGMCSWVSNWYKNSKAKSGKDLAATMERVFFHGVLVSPPTKTLGKTRQRGG